MRVKYSKIENRLYSEHLEVQNKQELTYSLVKPLPRVNSAAQQSLQTNFSISLSNQFAFILLHLKKSATTKNKININIPQICIFHSHLPYEILYSENRQIKGFRGKQSLKLKQVLNFFKMKWKQKSLSKQEPCIVCFQNKQYLLLTDTDLFILCQKFKNDPFFNKVAYIKNKINVADSPIISQYSASKDCEYTGEAMECLMDLINQKQFLSKNGEENYLRLCNTKICLFLNYQHNIRISKCTFYYSKTANNVYYLVDARNIEFINLTKAINRRLMKIKQKQEERNKCIVMTPEKEEKYRKHEKSPLVKTISMEMNVAWQRIANNLKLKTNEQRKRQQQNTQKAFHVLYPSINDKFEIVLSKNNFKIIKKDLLKFQQRKPLFKRTNHFINCFKTEKSLVNTQPSIRPFQTN